MKSGRTLTFFALVAFSLAQVLWWCYYEVRSSGQVAEAAASLEAGRAEDVPRAFGAQDAEQLATLAARQRRMFLVEGATFALLLLVVAALFWRGLRREDELRARQDRFLAGATHELKTPLATIRLGLQSIGDRRLPEETRLQYAHGLLPQIDRLSSGVENLLSAAGLRSASPQLQLVAASLREDVTRALELVEAQAATKSLRFELAGEDDVRVLRDANAMRMILHNLLDNAIKYSEAGARCRVVLGREPGHATLCVEDEGRGMTREELARAFDAFWRGRDDHVGGAGLGLHLVRELARAHGGDVVAQSAGEAQGARFTLRLPLAPGAEDAA